MCNCAYLPSLPFTLGGNSYDPKQYNENCYVLGNYRARDGNYQMCCILTFGIVVLCNAGPCEGKSSNLVKSVSLGLGNLC